MPRPRAVLVTSLLALGYAGLVTPPAHAVVPGKPGKIAFHRIVGGTNAEIFVMKADGSNQVNITNDPAFDTRRGTTSAARGRRTARGSRSGARATGIPRSS